MAFWSHLPNVHCVKLRLGTGFRIRRRIPAASPEGGKAREAQMGQAESLQGQFHPLIEHGVHGLTGPHEALPAGDLTDRCHASAIQPSCGGWAGASRIDLNSARFGTQSAVSLDS